MGMDMAKAPLIFTYYIAAPVEKVWDGFVSKEANHKIFVGADFEADLKPGGAMTWSGPGKDGKPIRYVTGEVLRVEAPKLFEYKFGMGDGAVMSRVKVELTPETEAGKVVVRKDAWTVAVRSLVQHGFSGKYETTVVNAHGCGVILAERIEKETPVVVELIS